MITEILVFMLAALFFFKIFNWSPHKNFPPGPIGIPFFGYAPFLGSNPFRTLGELSKKYGNMYGIYIGPLRCVILNSVELIREAGKKTELCGRPTMEVTKFWASAGSTDKSFGILFNSDISSWAEQRRFSLRNLKNLGLGKRSMEDVILNEANEFIEILRTKEGELVSFEKRFEVSMVNVLWTIVTSVRYSHNDPQLKELAGRVGGLAAIGYLGVHFYFPRLAKLLPQWKGIVKSIYEISDYIRNEIKQHKETYVANETRDFMDVYLKEIFRNVDSKSSFYKETGELSMRTTIMDLFVAGIETSSTALTWACLYLASYPEVQEKVLKEIDEVVGRDRTPVLADKEKLPYLEATIHETMRFSSFIPLLLFHNTVEDVHFQNYQLPKDTAVVMNAYHVMHDPEIWQRPNEFYPEHFLAPDGSFRNREAFIIFGIGKRMCIGETLARMEVFLFLSSILHEFRLEVAPGPKPSLEFQSPGFTLRPRHFQLVLRRR